MGKQLAIPAKSDVTVTAETKYAGMSAVELDALIKTRFAQCTKLYAGLTRNSDDLYLALAEMETRFQKQERYRTDLKPLKSQGWHQYLESRGVRPATFRKWKNRRLLSLTRPKAVKVVPDVNVTADELTRALASIGDKLKTVVNEQARLNPAVRANLLRALNNITPIAEQLDVVVEAPTGMCHQRAVRENLAQLPEPDLDLKRALAKDFTHATVREISFEEAKNLILANEYLGSMGSATHYVGLFFGEYLAGVECFGLVGGTNVASSICGPEHKDKVRVLVRGCCTHWAHPHSASWLLSRACDVMAERGFPIVVMYSDPAANEVGTCYSAVNAVYTGMTTPTERYRTPDGKEHDARMISGLTRDRRNGGLTYKRTRKEQRKILEEQGCEFYQGTAKHRYVLISGKWKRQLMKALAERLPSLPYPKRPTAVLDCVTDYNIHTGSVLEVLPSLPSNSFHGCLTDPPYELGFMGNRWDSSGIAFSVELWSEVLRVLTPGSYLMVFGGTRTHHRMTCAIEDAGFEIRDCLMWMYGTGFPKSKACLKPSYEPIILARKPGKTVLPLNIDGCRIGTDEVGWRGTPSNGDGGGLISAGEPRPATGRWPSNTILDESFTEPWSRYFYCAKASRKERDAGCDSLPLRPGGSNAKGFTDDLQRGIDRNKPVANNHPTVKPLSLTEYLAKLILPVGSQRRLLVPFSGSGSEMIGGLKAGWDDVTGIELLPTFVTVAEARLKAA